MLTARGWWFLIVSLVVLVLGVFEEIAPLVPLGLALVLWVSGVGLLFYAQARLSTRRLQVRRVVADERGPVENLWAGRAFAVRVELHHDGFLSLPHVAVTDRVPFATSLLGGKAEAAGPVARDQPLTMTYQVRAAAPGRIRFEGLRLRLTDLQGLFYFETFLPAVVEYRVLPVLADARGRPAVHKRHNLLPPPGIHRLRRPGSGSELLDLRDYLPGDPPKTIAWKVSARRDRLVTKEFESEVPIRCTLFVDTSNSVRVGSRGQNALGRLVEIAAAVTQANSGSRDLTGVCLFDDRQASLVRPARTPRHLVEVLHRLTDAAGLAPTTGQAGVDDLLPLAYALAREVYPDLLRQAINHFPFWLPWWSPRPAWTMRRPTFAQRLAASLPLWVALFLIVGCGGGFLAGWWILTELDHLSLAWGLLPLGMLAGWLIVLRLMARASAWFPWPRRQERWRKKLAALLSVRHDLEPGGLAVLLEDDELMALHLQRFLAEHHVPYTLPFHDERGSYLFATPQKVDVLTQALLQAVGKGHDNELLVVLADLIELPDRLEPLVRAVRVARARHHQVLIVCPWPPGLAPPRAAAGETGNEPAGENETGAVPGSLLRSLLRRSTAERFHQGFANLRRTFARLGVPVVCAANEDSVRLILERMDRLRLAGRRR